jgi:hypothetical protein
MATLIKIKKVKNKTLTKQKKHSLMEAFGAAKQKGFNIEVKPRKELWER